MHRACSSFFPQGCTEACLFSWLIRQLDGRMIVLSDTAFQAAAGAIMWVLGSVAFLIPAGCSTIQVLQGPRVAEWPGHSSPRPLDREMGVARGEKP